MSKDPDYYRWAPIDLSTTWQAVKAQVLQRPWNGRCEYCGKRSPVDAHHRHLHGQGGADLCWNLAALCRVCHDFCHAHPVEAGARGFMVESWQDPAEVEVTLWDGMVVRLDTAYGYEIVRFDKAPVVLA